MLRRLRRLKTHYNSRMQRCRWCSDDPIYQAYHDTEWGVPSYDARHLFEKLLLEGFQAGLSWITVLKKRPHYRDVMFNFDAQALASMSDDYIETLMQDAGIIRNRLKLNAARTNARAWLELPDPVDYLWSFVGGRPVIHHYAAHQDIPVISPEAQTMSRALKKAGFTFVGPTICHSYLQAVGGFMDHTTDCFRHAALSTTQR